MYFMGYDWRRNMMRFQGSNFEKKHPQRQDHHHGKKHHTTVGDCHGPVIDRRESWMVNGATCGDEWSSRLNIMGVYDDHYK